MTHGKSTNYVVQSIAVDPRHWRQVKAAARARGQSVSAFMRLVVFQFISRERRKQLARRAVTVSVNGPVAPARAVAE